MTTEAATCPVERAALTKREREVLILASNGETAKEIAPVLGISARAVEVHIMHVIRKLGAQNRTHAVASALRQKLID